MRRVMSWVICIIVVSLLFSSCDQGNTESFEEAMIARESEELEQMNLLLSKHDIINPIVMTNEDLDKLSYSIEFQDKYVDKNIILINWIDDIKRVDNKIYLESIDWFNEIYYNLTLSSEQYAKLIEISNSSSDDSLKMYSDYIILAQITNISRSRATLNAYGNQEEGFNFEIDLPGYLIFSGKCVDIALFESED